MIVGTGVDIASLARMREGRERFGERFLSRVLSARERPLLPASPGSRADAFLAGRWAAKEAFVKALGTGFSRGIAAPSISVLNDPSGAPRIQAGGAARDVLRELGVTRIHVSISHDRDHAVAMVVLER